MTKELKGNGTKQAWENATVVMKAKKSDDLMGSKKTHDEAEKLRNSFGSRFRRYLAEVPSQKNWTILAQIY